MLNGTFCGPSTLEQYTLFTAMLFLPDNHYHVLGKMIILRVA